MVNLDTLEELRRRHRGRPRARCGRAASSPSAGLVKVLGRGELTKAAHGAGPRLLASAGQAIEAAGGRVEIVPAPWGDGRPPAKGNALTNR